MKCPLCNNEMNKEDRLDPFNDCVYELYVCRKCGHTIRRIKLE